MCRPLPSFSLPSASSADTTACVRRLRRWLACCFSKDDVASSERLACHSARGRLFQHRFRTAEVLQGGALVQPRRSRSRLLEVLPQFGGAVSLPHHRLRSKHRRAQRTRKAATSRLPFSFARVLTS